MPLVTITCDAAFYPSETAARADLTTQQAFVVELGRLLPEVIAQNAKPLFIDDDTPVEAVQVDFKRFHQYAVNAVNVWIKLELTESDLDEPSRHEGCVQLYQLLRSYMVRAAWPIDWALDIFYGPGHGVLSRDDGSAPLTW